jgi:large subunit ribosomal protein L15
VAVLNLDKIEKSFKEGETVNPKVLSEKGLVPKMKGKTPKVKILSFGDIKKALVFENCLASKSAKEKIEKAGGKI